MTSRTATFVATVAIFTAVFIAPVWASGVIPVVTVIGTEKVETFNVGTEYDLQFTIGQTEYLDMDLSSNSDYFLLTGGFRQIVDYPGASIRLGPGSYNIDVTLEAVLSQADPYGGFELTQTQIPLDNLLADLPLPSPTPLPPTLLMLLGGILLIGYVSYRGSKRAPSTAFAAS